MVKSIMKDVFFLNQKSELATKADTQVINVGMAANMIGVKKRIIAISMGVVKVVMINLVIVNKWNQYETEEGCLSLIGVRKTIRFKEIEVEYMDSGFNKRRGKYFGWTAQIIQHEVDHCNGIVV